MNNPSRVAFTLFGRDVYWYGVLMALGILIAVWLTLKEGKRKRLTEDDILDMCLVIIPSGVVGARLYYVIFEWASYASNPIRALYIWEGGLAIYGAVIGGLLGMFIYSRVRKIRFLKLADCIAPGLVLAQAIGRWGNFINREAFGVETDIFCRMGLTTPDGVTVYVHPTFLYESLWNFAGLIILYILLRRGARKYDGQFTWLYVLWYGLGRAWVEGLRTDSLYIGSSDIRISQLLAIVSALAAAVILIINARKKHSLDELFVNRSKRTKNPDGQERS